MLRLHSGNSNNFTIISNDFIDNYMTKANGEYVKIYIYLYRCLTDKSKNTSVSEMADVFEHTEKDINRALKFWEEAGLMKLSYDDNNELCDIIFTNNDKKRAKQAAFAREESPATEEKKDSKPMYSGSLLKQKIQKDEVSELVHVAERFLGKTLSNYELNTILYFYETLHFTSELIEYLIEYSVSREHKSMRYIESVALAWAKDGITTVEKAKDSASIYNKNVFSVMKAFGINNRNPAEVEKRFIDKWFNTFCFTTDIILEACSRTIKATHQPSFEYADRILCEWHSKGVKHLSDVKTLDEKYTTDKTNKKQYSNNNKESKPVKKGNFTNFEQRDYDYEKLEKELFNKF